MDDDDEFYPGDIATIKVKILGNYNSEEYKYPFNPNITVNGSMGNSSYVTDVHSDFGNDTNNWRILFKPIMVGVFYMVIDDEHFRVHDNSLHFHVSPGFCFKYTSGFYTCMFIHPLIWCTFCYS